MLFLCIVLFFSLFDPYTALFYYYFSLHQTCATLIFIYFSFVHSIIHHSTDT
ncbi:hypothetical protein BDC45DRAFT_510870 [Circinella umbellata]|nr:hypothetical protein BDC45DRAFT_510870 [Circinella umbellata]